jgi:hypothetical protein
MGNAPATLALPALLLTAAGLLAGPSFAEIGKGGETLAGLLARERIDLPIPRKEDLAKLITSGDELETAETRIVATYVEEGDRPGDRLFVFRRAKAQGSWRAAEVRWPAGSEDACGGRSITEINVVHGYIYLTAHLTPSADCTLVLTEDLEPRDTLYGWPVAHFQDGRVVYEHSQIHFAPTHYAELLIYDPVTRRQKLLYPPKPETQERKIYREQVRVAYERCCVEHPAASCGPVFAGRNHHCDPDLFENSVGEVVVNDAMDSLAFTAQFDDIVGKDGAIYFFRHLRDGTPEVREIWTGDIQTGAHRLLGAYLTADVLNALFEGRPETLPLKAWHTAPDPNPASSTAYPFIPWIDVLRIRVGMSEAEVEKLTGHPLQFYHHPVNAILFSTTPDARSIEIALKRAPDGSVEDISYRLREDSGEPVAGPIR